MVNNYNFSVLMKKKMPFSMFLIFERVSNKGKSCRSSFSRSYIIFVLTSGTYFKMINGEIFVKVYGNLCVSINALSVFTSVL